MIAAVLRLPSLGDQSIWRDEAATLLQVNGSFADVFSRTAADNYPPLYNLLTWASVQLLGGAEWVLRLPAALLGIANVALIYGLGSRIGGRTIGLIAALLLALSGFHIWYSQEARMYTLLACAATAHAWAMLHFLARPQPARTVLLALSGIPLVYAHPYGALNWIAIGVGALWIVGQRRDWRTLVPLVLAELAIALSFMPWALILLGRARTIAEEGFWIGQPTSSYVLFQLRRVTSALFIPLVLAIPYLTFLRGKTGPGPSSAAMPLLLWWTLLPGALGIVASLLIEPVFYDRYLIGSLPAFLILFSLALLAPARTQRGVVLACTIGTAVACAALLFESPKPRDEWRDITAAARASLGPDDCLTMSTPIDEIVLDYYLPARGDCFLAEPTAEAAAAAAASGRIFVLAGNMDQSAADAFVAPLRNARPLLSSQIVGGGVLYVLGPAADGEPGAISPAAAQPLANPQ